MWLGMQVLPRARQRGGPDPRAIVTTVTPRPPATGDGPHRVAATGCRSDRLMSGHRSRRPWWGRGDPRLRRMRNDSPPS